MRVQSSFGVVSILRLSKVKFLPQALLDLQRTSHKKIIKMKMMGLPTVIFAGDPRFVTYVTDNSASSSSSESPHKYLRVNPLDAWALHSHIDGYIGVHRYYRFTCFECDLGNECLMQRCSTSIACYMLQFFLQTHVVLDLVSFFKAVV